MKLTWKTIQNLWANQTVVYDLVSDYGEPGYSLGAGKDGVILGDYNGSYGDREPNWVDRHPRIMAQLETQFELEWHDEWLVDSDHDKAYRTQPDSYSWLPSYQWLESGDGILTLDDELETWVDELQNDPKKALTLFTRPELQGIGFEPYPDSETYFETGWHEGQDDSPEAVYDRIRADLGQSVDILFHIPSKGQFDVRWTVYVRDNGTGDNELDELEQVTS